MKNAQFNIFVKHEDFTLVKEEWYKLGINGTSMAVVIDVENKDPSCFPLNAILEPVEALPNITA